MAKFRTDNPAYLDFIDAWNRMDMDAVIEALADDIVYGNQGADSLMGQNGNDTIYGGQNDGPATLDFYGQMRMMQGTETIHGGSGHDLIYGQFGNELLNGDGDNDTILGGQGEDTLNGQE